MSMKLVMFDDDRGAVAVDPLKVVAMVQNQAVTNVFLGPGDSDFFEIPGHPTEVAAKLGITLVEARAL